MKRLKRLTLTLRLKKYSINLSFSSCPANNDLNTFGCTVIRPKITITMLVMQFVLAQLIAPLPRNSTIINN